jgi:competence protein ComEC
MAALTACGWVPAPASLEGADADGPVSTERGFSDAGSVRASVSDPVDRSASTPSSVSPEEALRIHFLDVGQGDAVLIESPAGRRVLYDGGEVPARLMTALERAGTTSLEMVIASHAHADHIGGLAVAIRAFPPRFFMDNGIPHTTQTYGRLMEAVLASGAQLLDPEARTLTLDGVSLHVIPPPGDARMGHNDNSLGLLVEYGAFRAFLGGDAEHHLWAWWVENHAARLPPVQVHKASHHGSRNGDTAEGIARLRPEVVVIGVGAQNTYGHPHADALRLYAGVGATILRTDEHGTVTVTAARDGTYEVAVERGGGVPVSGAGGVAPGAGAPTQAVPMQAAPMGLDSSCIDLNAADSATLERLPGIGPALARAIVEARAVRPFPGVPDLVRVRGIGAATVDRIAGSGMVCGALP